MAEHKPQRSRVEWVQDGGARAARKPQHTRPRREGRVKRVLHRRLSARQALLLCLVLATITGLVALSARAALTTSSSFASTCRSGQTPRSRRTEPNHEPDAAPGVWLFFTQITATPSPRPIPP